MIKGLIEIFGLQGTIWESLIPFLVIAAIIFVLLREFFCWFWKINKTIELLEAQNKNIQELIAICKEQNNADKKVAARSTSNDTGIA